MEMNLLKVGRNIRKLCASWSSVLEESRSETTTHTCYESLQNISEGLVRCTRELQEKWNWDSNFKDEVERLRGHEGRAAAALLETVLVKEGLLGIAASTVLQNATLHVTLKTQAIELCRLVVLLDGHFAPLEPEVAEELVETCLNFLAVDFSQKVKRAALRLLRSALAPETGGGHFERKERSSPSDRLPLRAPAVERLLQRLSGELAYRANKLGTTVRSELFVVIAAILNRFKGYPIPTEQWLRPLLQQIAHRLDVSRGAPTKGQSEIVGALEALREVLFCDQTVGRLLPADIWGRVYTYVVIVGTQNVGAIRGSQETEGNDEGNNGEAAGQTLQQAALAVLLQGTEAFLSFIDRDIAADYAVVASPPSKGECLSSSKGSEAWTLLERLLSLTASPHIRVASTARRALSCIVGALCAKAGGGVSGSAHTFSDRMEQPEEAAVIASSTASEAAESSSNSLRSSEGTLECIAALRGFTSRVLADLRRDSLMQPTVQALQPEGWWQQCGCRGFVAYRCLPLFPEKERCLQGVAAAAACLRLAAAGCGSAWQQQHGASCTKHALHLLGAAGAIICHVMERKRSQGPSEVAPSPLEDPRSLKRRRVSAVTQQEPSTETEETQSTYFLHRMRRQEQRGFPERDAVCGGKGFFLSTSLCVQLRRVSVALFELYAKKGAIPRSLMPKAAAAMGRGVRALLYAASAEEDAAAAATAAAATAGIMEAIESGGRHEARELEKTGEVGGSGMVEDNADTEESDGHEAESSFHGGAAACALRRLIQESVVLALNDSSMEPPAFVSVALLWRTIVGGDGQGDPLEGELADSAYKLPSPFLSPDDSNSSGRGVTGTVRRSGPRPFTALGDDTTRLLSVSSWQTSLSDLLLNELFSFLARGVQAETALQGGAFSGLEAVSQAFFRSAGCDEDEAETADGLFLLSEATLAASSYVTPVQNVVSALPSTSDGGFPVETSQEMAADDGLLGFTLGLVGSRSHALLLQRVAGCLCHLLSDHTIRWRSLTASWVVAFAALLEEAIRGASRGRSLVALLQAARPLIDEWTNRENASSQRRHSSRVICKSTTFSVEVALRPKAQTATISTSPGLCRYCCFDAEEANPFAFANDVLGRLLLEVEAVTASFSAEEASAAAAMVLAAPDSFLFDQQPLFQRTLQLALRLGRANLSLACASISSLRRWLHHGQQQQQGEQLLQEVLPLLRPFLDASADRGGCSTAPTIKELHAAAQAEFAGNRLRSVASRLYSKRGSLKGGGGDDGSVFLKGWNPPILFIRQSILLLLGELGPRRALWLFRSQANLSLPGALALQSCDEWGETGCSLVSPEVFLRMSLPLGMASGAPLMCVPLKGFVVSVAKAAVDAQSRQSRATLCELLHALVCCISQKAAFVLSSKEADVSSAAFTHGAWAAMQEVRAASAVAAAAAMAALYRVVLPSMLELIASPDPVPRQLLSPLLLRSMRVSVDAALSPAPTPDPRLPAVLEVLSEGLADDSASRRSTAVAAAVALICMVLRRLNKAPDWVATAAAAHTPASFPVLEAAPEATAMRREMLLLRNILEQTLILPVSHGQQTKRLGGIAVLSAVLPLGPVCRCAAARAILEETAFKAMTGLLDGMQWNTEARSSADSYSSYSCLPPSSLQTEQHGSNSPAASFSLQCLQGVAFTGQFLAGVHRSACLKKTAAAAKIAAVTAADVDDQPGMLEQKRRRHLLLQTQRLVKRLRRFSLMCGDRGTRDLCRSLLLLFEANHSDGDLSVAAATGGAAATPVEKAGEDWAEAAIQDIRGSLESLLLEGGALVQGSPRCEETASKLFLLLDGLSWVVEASAAAYARALKDTRILRCLRTAFRAVWLDGGRLRGKSFEPSLPLAEATLRLAIVRPSSGAYREDGTAPQSLEGKPASGRFLLDAVLEHPAEMAQGSLLSGIASNCINVDHSTVRSFPKKGEGHEARVGIGEGTQLSRDALVRSIIIFLLQPTAFMFTPVDASPVCLIRLAISVLKALAHPATSGCVTAAATEECHTACNTRHATTVVKEWVGHQRQQQEMQSAKADAAGMEWLPTTTRNSCVCIAALQGSNSRFLSSLFALIFPVKITGIEAPAKLGCPFVALHSFVEGLEALENVYGCGCFVEGTNRKKLLLTKTSPAAAAQEMMSAAAAVLWEAERGSLPKKNDFTTRQKGTADKLFWNLPLRRKRDRHQVAALLLRLGLLFLRCAPSSDDGFEDSLATITAARPSSEVPTPAAGLKRETQIFLSITSLSLTLLVAPTKGTPAIAQPGETAREESFAVSFLHTLGTLRRCLFGCKITRHPPHYVLLLHVLAALVRRQTAAAATSTAEVAGETSTTLLAVRALPSSEGGYLRESEQLLQMVLDALELWQSSGSWETCQQNQIEIPAAQRASTAALPSLRPQQAALADLFLALSLWRDFLGALPFRKDALKFIGNTTTQFLSGTVYVPTPVRAAILRGGFVAVILADLLHEASFGQRTVVFTAAAQRMAPANSSLQQQRPQMLQGEEHQQPQQLDEEQAFAARRGWLSEALHSCNDGISAMIAAVFPLTTADLKGIRGVGGAPFDDTKPALKGLAASRASKDARRYAALLNSFLDSTLKAFTAAADCEAEVTAITGAGAAAEASEGAREAASFALNKKLTDSGGSKGCTEGGTERGGRSATDHQRRFYGLSLCLTHLHDTLREEQHGFHQRICRFLASLVAICSQKTCPRLCLFVLSHCLTLLLADVPPQHLSDPIHQRLGMSPVFGDGAGTLVKRPPLGTRLVELLALPLLFTSGSTRAADSRNTFFCEVWSLLWGRLLPLLSPQWETVISVIQLPRADILEKQVAVASAVRQLQVFASACGFLEVLFSVTPLEIFKASVAPLLLQEKHGKQTAAAAAAAFATPPVIPVPPPGTLVTRQIIAAMSSAMRIFEEACFHPLFHYRDQQAEHKQAKEEEIGGELSALSESLRVWLWKGRVRAYGCLTAAVCSTQSNASLYVSLLVSESASLRSMVDDKLLSFAQHMRQQGGIALPFFAPSAVQTQQQQSTFTAPFSLSATFSSDRRHRIGKRGFQRDLDETAGGTFASLAVPASLIGGSQKGFLQAFRRGLRDHRSLFPHVSQSMARTRAGQALADQLLRDPQMQHANTFFQSLQPASIASRWLYSLSLAPAITSAFAATERKKIFAAAAAQHDSFGIGEKAAGSPQERVEALLSGQEDIAEKAFTGSSCNDAVNCSAILKLLFRVVDCATVRFSSEWDASASSVGVSRHSRETIGHYNFLIHLPPLVQALLRHCSCSGFTPAVATRTRAAHEEDRAWALRLVVLRLFLQRADVLRPLAERGLVDFVAESVADGRLLRAKRLHYWLRDIALLLIKWLQPPLMQGGEATDFKEDSRKDSNLAPLHPLTAARLATFAETLIRLSTCHDTRTHKLNMLLVGTLLEHLHHRLSVRESGSGVSLVSAAPKGIPFLQLPLLSFFIYESCQSVEETARFRLSGIAIVGFLCALERKQRSSLHLGGGPYNSFLCNRNLLLAASRAFLFPTLEVAVQAAGACGSLLSIFPMQPLLPEKPGGRTQEMRSDRECKDQRLTGTAFLSAVHRRLQQLSTAEAAAASGKPPTLCGCVSVRSRPPGRQMDLIGVQEQQRVKEDDTIVRSSGRDKEEEDRTKLLLYSFDYDGRCAASSAALATALPLAFFGAPGSVPRETFFSLLSHVQLLRTPLTTRPVSVQKKEEKKSVALLETLRTICCCDVADEAAKAPGCAILVVSFGMAAADETNQFGSESAQPTAPQDLAAAQDLLQKWQRELTDSLLDALELFWGDLLNHQRDSDVLLSAVSLLRSLFEKWGTQERLFGAIQAVGTFLKTPPDDAAVAAVLFEICGWLRGHSQEYADSPSLLSFMLGAFPHDRELRRRQLDYWFGDNAALPEAPSERISFLLSTGLSKGSASHMLPLLTAAICHQQKWQQVQFQERRPPQAADATRATPFRSFASILLQDSTILETSETVQPFPSANWRGTEATLPLFQQRDSEAVSQQLDTAATASVPALPGENNLGNQRFLWGNSTAGRLGQAEFAASDSSSNDEMDLLLSSLQWQGDEQEHRFAGDTAGLAYGAARRPMSRSTAVALQERRNRRVYALLHKHQNALSRKEDTVFMVRNHYAPGDALRFVVSPGEALQLVGEACQLNTRLAAEFLLLVVAAHSPALEEECSRHGNLPQCKICETDLLGLVAASQHALETCCKDGRSSGIWCRDTSLASLLQRLTLQAILLRKIPPRLVTTCFPMQLYELARLTETLEVALPLLEEMTCRQQQLLLYPAGRGLPLPPSEQTVRATAEGLRSFFSALYLLYRDLGQYESQRSALQLLAFHNCFKKEITNSLLRFWWDTDNAALRQQTAEALQLGVSNSEENELIGSTQEHHEETTEESLARRLLRDAHLQSLQRMMQWKSLMDWYAPPLHDASQAITGIGEDAMMVHTARGTADLKERIELGDGCIVRAALSVSINGKDCTAENLLERLMRLLSPIQRLGADYGKGTSAECFASCLSSPLKATICHLLSLHAATKGTLTEASLLVAEAASALQGLVVGGVTTVPSSLLVASLTRLSISLLIEQGISAIQEDKRKLAADNSTGAALEGFLAQEIMGTLNVPWSGEVATRESGISLWKRLEEAPVSGCLDALVSVSVFLGQMEQQHKTTRRLGSTITLQDVNTPTPERQQLLLPWELRCRVTSSAARQLVRGPGGLRAAAALVQDTLQRQQLLQQEQLLPLRDVTLFSTVIKLKLREISMRTSASSKAVAKAQQLLRLVQQEMHQRNLGVSGNRFAFQDNGDGGESVLTALLLSCHCAVLHELQQASSAVSVGNSKKLETAAREALKSLCLVRDCSTTSPSFYTELPATASALQGADTLISNLRGRLKCLWRCAELTKEILSALQEAGEMRKQDRRGGGMLPAERGVERRHFAVARLFCNIVVELVASGGFNSKYGRWGAALIPSVLLLCAAASCSWKVLSSKAGLSSRQDNTKESKEAGAIRTLLSSRELANEGQSQEVDLEEFEEAAETPAALESRLTRLVARVPVEVLRRYFPQLLSFISADLSGCLTNALLPSLHAVIARDPHGSFYALETATSGALRSHPLDPKSYSIGLNIQGQAISSATKCAAMPPSLKLLDSLRREALRRAPHVAHFTAACELLQPPERRLHQKLLQPLLEVLEEALGPDPSTHPQYEHRLPASAAERWRAIWMGACEAAVIDEHHALLGKVLDSRTKSFGARIRRVVCSFFSEHCEGDWEILASASPQTLLFSKRIADAVVELPVSKVLPLLRLLSDEAARHVADGSHRRRGVLRLSDVSPWLASFSSEWFSTIAGMEENAIDHTTRQLSVPFCPIASESMESPEVISFCERVVALPSKQAPLRLSLCASDGYCYSFLAKGGEDLRLDQRVQTLVQLLAEIGHSRFATGDKGLRLRSYGVLPMSETHGIVEWISCSSPMKAVCETYTKSPLAASPACMRYADFLNDMVAAATARAMSKESSVTIADVWAKIFELSAASVEEVFKDCVELAFTRTSPAVAETARLGASSRSYCDCQNCSNLSAPPVPAAKAISQCLAAIANTSEELMAFRKRFGASLATSAAVCYCLGIGDRHLGNLLLDFKTGECINIDFGYAFDISAQALPVPEIAPFRLSPCLLHVVGPPGARDYALLHSPLFHHSNIGDNITEGSHLPHYASCGAAPTHAWAAGTLGLFESCFGEALDFIRSHRLVVEAIVEMFVKEPFAAYREAAGRNAATWWLQEEAQLVDPFCQATQQVGSAADNEAPTQNLLNKEKIWRSKQSLAVTARPSCCSHFSHASTHRESQQAVDQDEAVAQGSIAFVRRKLRGEHPSLILIDLLQSHCEPYVASATALPNSVLHTMVVGTNPPRARFSLLDRPASGNPSEPPGYEKRYLSASEQAHCLIELATDSNILGRAWRGFQAFI